LLTSVFFVNRTKNSRYFVEDPTEVSKAVPSLDKQYKYLSTHGISSSFLYYWMYKNQNLRKLIIPALIVDLLIWGPYYSNGALAGLAFGIIL
jgi:hypothetical protein